MPRIVRILLRLVLATVVVLLVLYAGDSLVLRLRAAPFGSVKVRPYLAVPHKNGQTEFMFQPPRDESCANALFPHAGQMPCWYTRRHTERRIDV